MTSLRARILEIQGTPHGLTTFVPGNPKDFHLSLAVRIGPSGVEGGDFFYLSVCSAEWLARSVRDEGFVWGRGLLVVDSWDAALIEGALQQWCESVSAQDWRSLAAVLSRQAAWEFEAP